MLTCGSVSYWIRYRIHHPTNSASVLDNVIPDQFGAVVAVPDRVHVSYKFQRVGGEARLCQVLVCGAKPVAIAPAMVEGDKPCRKL